MKQRSIWDSNDFLERETYFEMFLYNQNGFVKGKTLIDKENFESVSNFKWHLGGDGYVARKNRGKSLKLHVFILGKKEGFEIDHINRDKTDNRKENLRFVTRIQNSQNKISKGYSYARLRGSSKKWDAHVTINYKTVFRKFFETEEEAKQAVKAARLKYHGEFRYKENVL